MYNTSNPAELYPNTIWELLPDNKFLKTGSTPLQLAGNNSINITKVNLPAIQLQTEAHSHTQPTHYHSTHDGNGEGGIRDSGYYFNLASNYTTAGPNTQYAGGENTGTASPKTEVLGSGTPITINPEHITIKAWKRLS